MSMQPVLTIAIPTFNRVDCLRLLVDSLFSQLDADSTLTGKVQIIVSSNCSTDGTSAYLASIARPEFHSHTQSTNVGADNNLCDCFLMAKGRFTWFMGDDDLLKKQGLRKIVAFLEQYDPDLLYIENRWISGPLDRYVDDECPEASFTPMTAVELCMHASTYLTFWSGMVINRARYVERFGVGHIRRYSDTFLSQLEWVLALLRRDGRYATFSGTPLLARAGNTGGYGVLKVFSVNYPKILRQGLSDVLLRNVLLHRHLCGYLPGLIWGVRFANIGAFSRDFDFGEIDRELGGMPSFSLFVAPICRLPRWCAKISLRVSQVITRIETGIFRLTLGLRGRSGRVA
jgi:abequosyltransferase